uniref:Putative secreted protein n=1 Tax=Ixodes ricinus TaxID=34613 RepID=A0A6B0UCL6_IXORI
MSRLSCWLTAFFLAACFEPRDAVICEAFLLPPPSREPTEFLLGRRKVWMALSKRLSWKILYALLPGTRTRLKYNLANRRAIFLCTTLAVEELP